MPPLIPQLDKVSFGFSQASDGDMSRHHGFANRLTFLEQQGFSAQRIVHAGSVHGNTTSVITAQQGGQIIEGSDGLITADINVILTATAADCLIVFAVDPVEHVVGILHAGRKGLAIRAITEFFQTWQKHFPATNVKNIVVDVSPRICGQHYTVLPDVAQQFVTWPAACQMDGSVIHLDLQTVAQSQLLEAGLGVDRIRFAPVCTFENTTYFSHRRDRANPIQVQVGWLKQG